MVFELKNVCKDSFFFALRIRFLNFDYIFLNFEM